MEDYSKAIELAWSAGFYDGEGHYAVSKSGRRMYAKMSIAQVDRRPLDRFLKAVEKGTIYKSQYTTRVNEDWNTQFVWQASSKEDVEAVVKSLWPYLTMPKREQIEEKKFILEEHNKANPLKRRENGNREHGTISMYQGGCRCVDCKRANSIYYRKYRSEKAKQR